LADGGKMGRMAMAIQLGGVGAGTLSYTEIPDAVAGPGGVAIAVEAASVNPVDRGAVDPGYGEKMPGPGPWILGWDLAGRITSVGARVDAALVGSRVLGFSQWFKGGPGLQRSQVALPLDNIAVVGEGVPSTALTTFGLNGLTALQVLDAAELREGESVLLVGASGGVGGLVADIARSRGITVLTGGRDTPPADFAGMELDALINTAPADPTRYLVAVKDDGVATSVTTPAETERGIRSSRVGVKVDRGGLAIVARLADEGVLTTVVAQTFPAAEAAAAYAADGSAGRIVVTFA
jgi:NADPH:quinone reductase-like Zn-dependent oxidoreductase